MDMNCQNKTAIPEFSTDWIWPITLAFRAFKFLREGLLDSIIQNREKKKSLIEDFTQPEQFRVGSVFIGSKCCFPVPKLQKYFNSACMFLFKMLIKWYKVIESFVAILKKLA